MWIAIGVGIPVLIAAILVAVWPLISRSVHRWEDRRSEGGGQVLPGSRVRHDCPLCAASFEAASDREAVAAKNAHVLRSHAQSGSEAVPATALLRQRFVPQRSQR